MSESLATANRNAESYLTYSTVKGYFLQDEEDTDSSRFDYVCFLSTSDNYPGGYRRLIVDRLRLISASLIGHMIMRRALVHDTKDMKMKLKSNKRHNGPASNDKFAL